MLNETEQRKRLEHGVWLDEVDRAFRAWRAASQSEKSQLLLNGMTLTWAENWRLTNAGDFSPATHSYIARSLAAQSTKVSGERRAADEETRRRDKAYQQILLLMALFAIVILGPNAVRQMVLQPPAQTAARSPEPTGPQAVAVAIATPTVMRPTVIADDLAPQLRSPSALAEDARLAARQGKGPLARRLALEAVFASPPGHAPVAALSLIAETGRERAPARWDHNAIAGADVVRSCDGGRVLARTETQWLVVDPAAERLSPIAPAMRPLDVKAITTDCRNVLTTNDDYDVAIEALGHAAGRRKFGSHDAPVVAMRFSANGRRAVSVSRDGAARVWDIATGRAIARFKSSATTLIGTAIDALGSRIVTWSDDATAEFWDAATGARLGSLSGHVSPVVSASFTPDGAKLLTLSSDGTASVWSSETRARVNAFKPEGAIVEAWLSADARLVIARLDETPLQVWEIESGRSIFTVRESDAADTVALSPDGQWFALADRKGNVSVWDGTTGTKQLALSAAPAVLALEFTANGTLKVIGESESTAWPLPMTRESAVKVAKGHELCIEAPASPWCAPAAAASVEPAAAASEPSAPLSARQ